MNEQEIIQQLIYLKNDLEGLKYNSCASKRMEEALNKAIKALEKQIEKKVEIWNGEASCPCCNKLFGPMEIIKNLISWEMDYCKYCGQKLDWTVEE